MSPAPSFLVLTSLFLTVAALERVPAFQFRPARLLRPFVATDAAWYVVATTANLISTFVLRPQLSKLAIPGVADSIVSLPFVVRIVVAVVVYDFIAFAVHVAIHRSDRLWSVHKVHHSSLQLDGLATTRTHMFEHLLRNVPAQATLFALGMSAPTVATTLVIYAAFALHGHSNLRVGGRWLEMVFVTPRLHRLHHLPDTTQNNFGTVLTIWDRLFGRFVSRDARPSERTGVPGEIDEYPQRFVAAFCRPMKEARDRGLTRALTPRTPIEAASEGVGFEPTVPQRTPS
jgi:sterol desaturase/sphingolipid hydroxylase (fatty acid hydroxylase superfamily)